MKSRILLLKIIKRKFFTFSFIKWWIRGFNAPSPQFVKLRILRNSGVSDATWVETGTYLGETTKFLSHISKNVISIEPAKVLFEFTSHRLRKIRNITLVFGTSEEVFESVVSKLDGKVNFWLDGHGSGDITFANEKLTPILHELEIIGKSVNKFQACVVFVDDIRGFADFGSESKYPNKEFLIDWAQRNNFTWAIEQDIFIAKTAKSVELQE
jgi:hypothetical protein